MSKIKKITVSNLKAISALTADFNGCTAIITGGNNKGKTSFLRSLPDRLKQLKPEVVLKDGEDSGFSELELTTGEKFIWQFDNKTKAGEKLTFITKDNIKTSVTRDIANKYFPKGFDIDKFLNDTPKGQRDALQKIVGIDFSDIDASYKEAYDNRTLANRVLENSKAKLTEVDNDLGEEVCVLKLQSELSLFDSHNEKYEYVESGIESKKQNVERCHSEIERLEKLIEDEKEKIRKLSTEIDSGVIWLNKESNKKKDESVKKELGDKISKAIVHNEKVSKNNQAKKELENYKKLEEEAKIADEIVKSIEKEKQELIKSAKLPQGFGFDDNGITYNGHSFSKQQLSSSAIYIAALKLAALNIGEVKTLHFDASYLDKNSLSDIEKWAEENDLQLLIERPDFDGGDIEYQIISK